MTRTDATAKTTLSGSIGNVAMEIRCRDPSGNSETDPEPERINEPISLGRGRRPEREMTIFAQTIAFVLPVPYRP